MFAKLTKRPAERARGGRSEDCSTRERVTHRVTPRAGELEFSSHGIEAMKTMIDSAVTRGPSCGPELVRLKDVMNPLSWFPVRKPVGGQRKLMSLISLEDALWRGPPPLGLEFRTIPGATEYSWDVPVLGTGNIKARETTQEERRRGRCMFTERPHCHCIARRASCLERRISLEHLRSTLTYAELLIDGRLFRHLVCTQKITGVVTKGELANTLFIATLSHRGTKADNQLERQKEDADEPQRPQLREVADRV
ncbi:hypothetical protein BD410DRAFT_802367 [Rickenella mellea]|uniref:Uncharacterized protein n=1 Tax=Rickenella mellea TaxID=50990 RepID=A0A4Y7Q9N0_9AGAM|nr:hypothetical protein BD410DRAFT_802367 [Rickenella mellea]